ncbi:hypothetical protein EJ02DRAFT_457240 [Clathrospora elynae]|uniref:Uncharacterized protein n=1 Tax=Clathrospora elynae TaxID=706981 RepID=A0A6A5SKN7_9PLEO|nr:hypothetical protein EJ02DRAFT_457240 [Clathrospora elynae]
MSGAGGNGWRRQGQANRSNPDRNSGANTPTKENGRQQPISALSGNAWGPKSKGTGPAPAAPAAPVAPAQAPPEHHIPVNDFNANAVKDFLRKKYLESTADQPSAYYKVEGDSVVKRSSGAWGKAGIMPHLLPTGQDFFTQLKKQLVNMDQRKPAQ